MAVRPTRRHEGLDDAALGNGAVAALADDHFQLAAQGRQIGKFAFDLAEMRTRDRIHSVAGLFLVVGEREQCADLLDGKTELARPPGKGQAAHMSRRIVAVIAGRARRLRQQADLLVIADGLRLGIRGARQLSDVHGPA
jgi:hypothetical protein